MSNTIQPLLVGEASLNSENKELFLSFYDNVKDLLPDFYDNYQFSVFKNEHDSKYSIYSSSPKNILKGASHVVNINAVDFLGEIINKKRFNVPSVKLSPDVVKEDQVGRVYDVSTNKLCGFYKSATHKRVGSVFDRGNDEFGVVFFPNLIESNYPQFSNNCSRNLFLAAIKEGNDKIGLYMVNELRCLSKDTLFVFEFKKEEIKNLTNHSDFSVVDNFNSIPSLNEPINNLSFFSFKKSSNVKENFSEFTLFNKDINKNEITFYGKLFAPKPNSYNIWSSSSFQNFINELCVNYLPNFVIKEDLEKKYEKGSYIKFEISNNYFFKDIGIDKTSAIGVVKGHEKGKLIIESPIFDKPFTLSPYIVDLHPSNNQEFNKFKDYYQNIIRRSINKSLGPEGLEYIRDNSNIKLKDNKDKDINPDQSFNL